MPREGCLLSLTQLQPKIYSVFDVCIIKCVHTFLKKIVYFFDITCMMVIVYMAFKSVKVWALGIVRPY